MINILELSNKIKEKGYSEDAIEAKICQDIILMLLSKSKFNRNVTIKGGVVMNNISKDARRATIDIDFDLIKYPLSVIGIKSLIKELNNVGDIKIKIVGKIEELKHQNYHGKRVFVMLKDSYGNTLTSKLDIGVHKYLMLDQIEYCFDVASSNEGVTLLINSKEQMFTEKLKSLLRFGVLSTRFKDIYDLCYLIDYLDKNELQHCLDVLIFSDKNIKEKNVKDIYFRLKSIFSNEHFVKNLSTSRKNWINIDNKLMFEKILNFLFSFSLL